jgi:hypothetical protein
MFLLGLALPLVFIPAVTGYAILSGWVLLSLTLGWFLLKPIQLTAAHWLGLAFLGYATLSMAWTPIWAQGIWALWLLYLLAFAFCLTPTRGLWLGLALGVGVSTLLACAQLLGWSGIFQAVPPAGLFVNRDLLGETAALVSVALIANGLYWPLALTLPAIPISNSRTALAALGIALAFILWRRSKLLALGLVLALALAVVVAKPNAKSVNERLAIWTDTATHLTPLGHGAGSFFILYPSFATTDTFHSRPEYAHNDFLELVFEFGIGAAPLFALLALAATSLDPLLMAFLVIATLGFPLHCPVEGFVGMVALGSVCRGRRLAWAFGAGRRSALRSSPLQARGPALPLEPLHPHAARL